MGWYYYCFFIIFKYFLFFCIMFWVMMGRSSGERWKDGRGSICGGMEIIRLELKY